jgi:hypothetical protein
MDTTATLQNPSNSQHLEVSKFRETVLHNFQPTRVSKQGSRGFVFFFFFFRGLLFPLRRWMQHENMLLLFRLSEERRRERWVASSDFHNYPTSAHEPGGLYLSSSLLMTAVCYSAPPPPTHCWNYFCTVVFDRMFPFSSFARVRWWMIPDSISSYVVLDYCICCVIAPYWFKKN